MQQFISICFFHNVAVSLYHKEVDNSVSILLLSSHKAKQKRGYMFSPIRCSNDNKIKNGH